MVNVNVLFWGQERTLKVNPYHLFAFSWAVLFRGREEVTEKDICFIGGDEFSRRPNQRRGTKPITVVKQSNFGWIRSNTYAYSGNGRIEKTLINM